MQSPFAPCKDRRMLTRAGGRSSLDKIGIVQFQKAAERAVLRKNEVSLVGL